MLCQWRDCGGQQEHPFSQLTYEQYEDKAEFIQIDVRVGERVAECRVDDREEHTAADSAKRGFGSFKPVLDVSSDALK